MLRNEWKFSYRTPELLKGAEKKFNYHSSRFAFWTKAQKDVEEKIKKEGLEFDRSLASANGAPMSAFSNTYGRQPSVSVRDDLLRDLQETNQKIAQHDQKRKEYSCWVQILADRDCHVECNHDDWLFFFGE